MSDPTTPREKVSRKLKVTIDEGLCIGAATCIAIAPKAFALDGNAKAIILDGAEESDDTAIIEAAKSCPVMAILIDDETGKRLYP